MEMSKLTKFITSLFLFLILGTFQNILAQDTVDVVQGLQTLDAAIQGDVDANGDPLNLNRVWRLQRGGYYYIGETLTAAKGSPLRIVAAKGEGHRPLIIPAILPSIGSSPRPFTPSGDGEFIDLYVSGIDDTGEPANKNMFRLEGEGSTYILDKCYFDHDRQAFIRQNSPDQKLYITNCIFRDASRTADPWDGIMLASRGGYQDIIFVENNTFMVASNRIWQAYGGVMANVTFNHNTFAQTGGGWYDGNFESNRTVNLTVTNNLFMDINLEGDIAMIDGVVDTFYQEIWPIDSLYADETASDDERNILFSNNVYGWSQETIDYINSYNGEFALFSWHNANTEEMIAQFDGMVDENNIEETVVFADAPDINVFLDYARDKWENQRYDGLMDIRADKNGISSDWTTFGLTDAEYDFSYSESHAAYTHGTDGKPVGDLNWFPDIVSVKPEKLTAVPTEFSLDQNYPNPFNPTTTIRFSIPAQGNVTLTVHNVLGELVSELVNEELASGSYTYQFDASLLSSGVYFYSVASNKSVITKKMLLMK